MTDPALPRAGASEAKEQSDRREKKEKKKRKRSLRGRQLELASWHGGTEGRRDEAHCASHRILRTDREGSKQGSQGEGKGEDEDEDGARKDRGKGRISGLFLSCQEG